jgi:hypothetical protein
MNKDNLLRSRDDAVKKFNLGMGKIIQAVKEKQKNNTDIIAIQDMFSVARKEAPEMIVQMAGPYLWKYREPIMQGDSGFFLDNDFEQDIIEAQNKKDIAEISEFENTALLMQCAKRTWHMFLPMEKENVIKLTKGLLSDYVKYLSACRALSEQ